MLKKHFIPLKDEGSGFGIGNLLVRNEKYYRRGNLLLFEYVGECTLPDNEEIMWHTKDAKSIYKLYRFYSYSETPLLYLGYRALVGKTVESMMYSLRINHYFLHKAKVCFFTNIEYYSSPSPGVNDVNRLDSYFRNYK